MLKLFFNTNANKFLLPVTLLLYFWCAGIYANVFITSENGIANLYLGTLNADEEPGVLQGPSSNIAIGVARSDQSHKYPYLAFDLELWLLKSEYANTLPPPLFISPNNEMELETLSLSIGARLLYPYDPPYQFYISGGYGYFHSRMRVYANISGTPGSYEDSSASFAPYIGAGLNYQLNHRQTLEIFYRKWSPDGDFSAFAIPKANLGGSTVGIGFGLVW